MKANELMIGDLLRVNRDGLCIKKGTIVWVLGIDGEDKLKEKGLVGACHCHPLDGEQFDGGIWLEYLDPIPLTSEILKKNEFHWGYTASEEDFCGAVGCGYPDKGWCYDEGAGEIKITFPNNTDGGLIMLDDQSGNRHLELIFVKPIMVHDLQHALRLCGIDKEITL